MSVDRTEPDARLVDRRIAAVAARQHGVVHRRQLRALGLGEGAITRRVHAGRLHRIHRAVYAVGHPLLGLRGRWMAAVLASGAGAVLSHESAAALWELRRTGSKIFVSVPSRSARTHAGVSIHRAATLRADEVTAHHSIPVTTPARTLLDLAVTLSPRRLERALDQAEIERLTDYPTLDALARAHPGHKGAAKLLRALTTHLAGTTLTKSDLEELFLELCRAATVTAALRSTAAPTGPDPPAPRAARSPSPAAPRR